jgi:hypothetical protein
MSLSADFNWNRQCDFLIKPLYGEKCMSDHSNFHAVSQELAQSLIDNLNRNVVLHVAAAMLATTRGAWNLNDEFVFASEN